MNQSAETVSGRPTRAAIEDLERQLRERNAQLTEAQRERDALRTKLKSVRSFWRDLGDALMDPAP